MEQFHNLASRNFYSLLESQCFLRTLSWYAAWNDGIVEYWPPARRSYASERILGMKSGKRSILQKMLYLHFMMMPVRHPFPALAPENTPLLQENRWNAFFRHSIFYIQYSTCLKILLAKPWLPSLFKICRKKIQNYSPKFSIVDVITDTPNEPDFTTCLEFWIFDWRLFFWITWETNFRIFRQFFPTIAHYRFFHKL
jgi:hypothetical protein